MSEFVVPLGQVVSLGSGGVWGEDAPTETARVAVRCLRGVDIAAAAGGTEPSPPIRYVNDRQLSSRILGAGDVVIEASGTNCGRSILVTQRTLDALGLPVVYSNFCRRLLIDGARADSEYVGYALRSLFATGEIQTYRTGSAIPNLDVAALLSRLQLRLPERDEQRAVAHVLRTLDEKIAVNERLLRVAREWIAAQYAVLAAVESTGWRKSTLGEELAVLETGQRPKGGVGRYAEGVPSLGAESVIELARYDYSKTKFVPTEFFDSMKRGVVHDLDVLLYKDGGRPGEFEPHVSLLGQGFPFDRFCINEHVYRLRAQPPLTQEYLYCWLASEPILDEMRRRGTGVAIPGLNSSAVRALPIAVPPADLIAEFTAAVKPVVLMALRRATETRALAQMRDCLLPPLMSGQLRVRNAHAVVGGVL